MIIHRCDFCKDLVEGDKQIYSVIHGRIITRNNEICKKCYEKFLYKIKEIKEEK